KWQRGSHRQRLATLRRSVALVEVQIGLAGDQREDLANLLEAGAQEKLRVAAIALRPKDVEIRFRSAQGIGPLWPDRKAVAGALLQQRRRQRHRAERRVALVDLQLAVEIPIGGVPDVGVGALDVRGDTPATRSSRH